MRIALLLLVGLALSKPAFARIGETTAQLDKRYGSPVAKNHGNEEIRRYSFRGFTITVGLDQGISQCEIYLKSDRSRMTEGEIHDLLQANAGKSPWLEDAEENSRNYLYWSKDKKSRVGVYSLVGHNLMVTSKPYLPRFTSLMNTNGPKSVEGF
jgi:hypothetical protein